VEFEHANRTSRIYGESLLPGIANYFPAGDPKTWTTNIPTYSRVRYSSLYPGIDVAFYGNAKSWSMTLSFNQGPIRTRSV
jgi:hypothetical protein